MRDIWTFLTLTTAPGPTPSGHVGGKRGSAATKDTTEEDAVAKFVLNDLVGPPPLDVLPVVKEEEWERMQVRRLKGVKPAAARSELAVVIEKEKEKEWLDNWEAGRARSVEG
ncbi:hypothetical protein PLESTF_000305300 [Pleodorina starrii]|nr:hypothetical protein PLESTM_001416200 [Pleodorina starrii]GLC65518.1 hypothetical protein PLESTF_000305300 [Pleodorina starrii]